MTPLQVVALHEAAHCVAAEALGHQVISVALDANGGNVHTRGYERTFEEIENSLVITMCGPIAEHTFCGTPIDAECFEGDRRCEAELVAQMAAITTYLDADLRSLFCEARATSLVLTKRKSIENLADQLMMREAV